MLSILIFWAALVVYVGGGEDCAVGVFDWTDVGIIAAAAAGFAIFIRGNDSKFSN